MFLALSFSLMKKKQKIKAAQNFGNNVRVARYTLGKLGTYQNCLELTLNFYQIKYL